VVGGGLAYKYRSELEENVHEIFNKTLQDEYGIDDNKGLTEVANKFMEDYKCCGTNGYEDWQRSTFARGNHSIVPDSCCREPKKDCGKGFTKSEINTKGCWAEFKEIVTSQYALIGGLGIGVGVILLHAAILAIVLSRILKGSGGTLA